MSRNSREGSKTGKNKRNENARRPAPGSSTHPDRSKVYWTDIHVEVTVNVIEAVIQAGGAVMFSRSSDGGALGTRIYHDDHEVETVWGRPDEDYAAKLDEIAAYYHAYESEEGNA